MLPSSSLYTVKSYSTTLSATLSELLAVPSTNDRGHIITSKSVFYYYANVAIITFILALSDLHIQSSGYYINNTKKTKKAKLPALINTPLSTNTTLSRTLASAKKEQCYRSLATDISYEHYDSIGTASTSTKQTSATQTIE